MQKHKYELIVQIDDNEQNYLFYYGYLSSTGNSLQELLENAVISVVNWQGVPVEVVPADSPWMLQLLEQEFYAKYGSSGNSGNNGQSIVVALH